MAKAGRTSKILPSCRRLAEEMGYELIDIEFQKTNEGEFLRILLDKEGGFALEDCEAYHKRVLPLVENINYDYLEVGSPGADRPMKKEKDFMRAIGTRVLVRLYKEKNGVREHTGELVAFENNTIILKNDAGESISIPLKDAAKAAPVIDIDLDEED